MADPFRDSTLRLSAISRASPTIISGQTSPTRSIRPVFDPSAQNISIFQDDSSDDEETRQSVDELDEIHGVKPAGRDGVVTPYPDHDPASLYRLTGDLGVLGPEAAHEGVDRGSLNSLTEKLVNSPPEVRPLRRKGHLSLQDLPTQPQTQDAVSPLMKRAQYDKLMELHARTLDALLLQSEAARKVTPPPPPPRLRFHRQPRTTGPAAATTNGDSPNPGKNHRKVSMAPEPIDVRRARSLDVRLPLPTPYPVHRTSTSPRDVMTSPRSNIASFMVSRSALLPIMISSRPSPCPTRVTTLQIPGTHASEWSATRPASHRSRMTRMFSSSRAEHDYDDSAFAQDLKSHYRAIVGTAFDLLAARTLAHIVVSGHASAQADRRYGWLSSRRHDSTFGGCASDRAAIPPALRNVSNLTVATAAARVVQRSDSSSGLARPVRVFDDAKLRALLRKPRTGSGRYAWVGWARRIAESAASGNSLSGDDVDATAAAASMPATPRLVSVSRGMGSSRQVSSASHHHHHHQFGAPPIAVHHDLQFASSRTRSSAPLPASEWARSTASRTPSRLLLPNNNGAVDHDAEKQQQQPQSHMLRLGQGLPGEDEFEGLVLVLRWSGRRIAAFLAGVVLLAVAAVLLWTFLGGGAVPGGDMAGLAGSRVGTGATLGVVVLLVGLTAFGGWMGLSWLAV